MTTYELHEMALSKVNELGLTKFLKGKPVESSICKIYDKVMKL